MSLKLERASLVARLLLAAGALNALCAVVAGAIGAHMLRHDEFGTHVALFHTAVQYHLFHALGVLIAGMLSWWRGGVAFAWAGGLMLIGIVLFCGSLYITALSGQRLGVTPFGGAAFMAAWTLFAVAALRVSKK